MNVDNRHQLIEVMKKEDLLLDEILKQQQLLHKDVSEKDWESLNVSIANLQELSDRFVSLEEQRTVLGEYDAGIEDGEYSGMLMSVRSKLQKSKVENHVLNQYVAVTRKFLQGVFDKVVPQRRNTLYSKNGGIVKPEMSSLVFNQVI